MLLAPLIKKRAPKPASILKSSTLMMMKDPFFKKLSCHLRYISIRTPIKSKPECSLNAKVKKRLQGISFIVGMQQKAIKFKKNWFIFISKRVNLLINRLINEMEFI